MTCFICVWCVALGKHRTMAALAINLVPPGSGSGSQAVPLTLSSVPLSLASHAVTTVIQSKTSEREEYRRLLERKRSEHKNPKGAAPLFSPHITSASFSLLIFLRLAFMCLLAESGGHKLYDPFSHPLMSHAATASGLGAESGGDALDVATVISKMHVGYESSTEHNLFSSALLELTQSLARLRPAAPAEKIARLLALCPKLPVARAISPAWTGGFAAIEAAMQSKCILYFATFAMSVSCLPLHGSCAFLSLQLIAGGPDSTFEGKTYESISFAPPPPKPGVTLSASQRLFSRGGTHLMDRRSEEGVLAVSQFLVLSRGQYGELLLPKLLQYLIALPFFTWNQRDQPVEVIDPSSPPLRGRRLLMCVRFVRSELDPLHASPGLVPD
jgi:hypothetical protein